MSIADRLDDLTQTFRKDRSYCDGLFASRNCRAAAELLVSHQWANEAFIVCQKLLTAQAKLRFRRDVAASDERGEVGAVWTLALTESMHRDMRLVTYLAFRGVVSASAVLLRRALEHAGVLTHLWRDPQKLGAFSEARGKQYVAAFRREFDKQIDRMLKKEGSSKRFAAMASGGRRHCPVRPAQRTPCARRNANSDRIHES